MALAGRAARLESLLRKSVVSLMCESKEATRGLEWFSFECRKTKTKVITLANHKEHRQYSEPIKIQSKYM